MNRKERFERSLRLQEVDKLPHGEQMIHDELCAKFTGLSFKEDSENALSKWMKELLPHNNFDRHKRTRELLNFDWVHLFPIEPFIETVSEEADAKFLRDIWGQIIKVNNSCYEIIEKSINTLEELKNFKFPSEENFLFTDITKWHDESDFWLTTQIDWGYFKVTQLVGFENYMMWLYDAPNLLHELMEKFVEFSKKMIDKLAAAGADSIWFSDDHAFNQGPFISMDQMQEFDFNYLKQVVEYVHTKGMLANFHSCGNIEKTLPNIIDTGVSSIHALQPSAGNEIIKYKKEYGKDICFIGNFDMDYLMPKGSVEEIDSSVREMISSMWSKDRTGYILSTCNMLNNDQPVENALILHMAAEKYGF